MFPHIQLLISTLLTVSSVLGTPVDKGNGTSNPCEAFEGGSGAYSNLNKFRVLAFKPGRVNNTEELVQAWVAGFPTTGNVTTLTVGKWNKNPNEPSLLNLVGGGLTGVSPDSAVGVDVSDNNVPYFISTDAPSPIPAPVWCIVPSANVTGESSEYGFLAARGRYDAWSLCYEEETRATRVAYNVDKTVKNDHFDVSTCAPAHLRVIPDSK